MAALASVYIEMNAKNPIIQDTPAGTMCNVACILSFLEVFRNAKDISEHPLEYRAWIGFYAVLGCIAHALDCEIERKRHAYCAIDERGKRGRTQDE